MNFVKLYLPDNGAAYGHANICHLMTVILYTLHGQPTVQVGCSP